MTRAAFVIALVVALSGCAARSQTARPAAPDRSKIAVYVFTRPPATRVPTIDEQRRAGATTELARRLSGKKRLAIVGVDPNYASEHVRTASLAALPFADGSFDRGLCLDVLEHLTFPEQTRALAELFRVIAPGGELLVSVPNLAHLQSRAHFLLQGRLIHTASLAKHPGDRPAGEFIDLASRAGFRLRSRRGIFPTVPVLTRWIRRSPARLAWLHALLTRLLPVPGWCFLNVLRFERP